MTSDGGKGSDRRPGVGFDAGWERIFGGSVQRKPAPMLESAPHCSPLAPHSLPRSGAGEVQPIPNPNGVGLGEPCK